MKIRIEQISEGETEVVLRFREKTREVEELLAYLKSRPALPKGWGGRSGEAK